ncbi:MAG: hypothetical protein Fur0021_38650 [Candidatus Promineifilaceae bacterium]
MWVIFMMLVLGTAVGYGLRGRRRWLVGVERATTAAVFALLFLLGVSVGGNEQVMGALGALGAQALGLSLAGMAGSIAATKAVMKWIDRRERA